MLISPPAAVLVWATCKVRHGAVRVQALVSRPLAEMKERVFSANAGGELRPMATTEAANRDAVILVIGSPSSLVLIARSGDALRLHLKGFRSPGANVGSGSDSVIRLCRLNVRSARKRTGPVSLAPAVAAGGLFRPDPARSSHLRKRACELRNGGHGFCLTQIT